MVVDPISSLTWSQIRKDFVIVGDGQLSTILNDFGLTNNYRRLWKDFVTMFVCPSRIPSWIREDPHPTPLAFTHCLRSNQVGPHPVSDGHVVLSNLNIDIFENYVAEIRLDGKPVELTLWDVACVSSCCRTTKVVDTTSPPVAKWHAM